MVKKVRQVVLLQDIQSLGKKGETKNVADGYALNFLLPKKLALLATEQTIKKLNNQASQKTKLLEQDKAQFQKLIKGLAGRKIIIKRKLSDSGKLFAGVSTKDIAVAVKQQAGVALEEKLIKLEKKLKESGEHKIKFGGGKFGGTEINLIIQGES